MKPVFTYQQVNGFFSVTSCVSIVLTLCCISIDRYIAVSRPLGYKSIVTVKRAIFALIIVWLQGILCGMLPIWGWSKYKYNPGTLHCSPSWNNCSLYVFSSVMGFALPVAVMVITYTKIFLTIRKHERKVSTRKWITKSRAIGKRNFSKESKTDTLNLSSSSKRQNKNVTFLQNESRAKVFTVPSSELFYQDGSTCGDYIRHILSRDDYTGCDFSTSFVDTKGLDYNSIERSRIVFKKDITQLSSKELAIRISKPKETSNRKKFESRLKLRGMRSRLSAHHGLPTRRARRIVPREYRIAKTSFFLLVAFLILWAPYLVVHSCANTVQFSSTAFHVAMWCVYMNGITNPVVYALNNRNVKLAFKNMMRKSLAT